MNQFKLSLKNQILLTTSIVLIIALAIYGSYILYLKNNFIQSNMHDYNKQFQKSFDVVSLNISDTLTKRIRTLSERNNHVVLQSFLNNTSTREEQYGEFYTSFRHLKRELPFIRTLHLYDINGFSLARAHMPSRFGDDLKTFRPIVKELVENPRVLSFYEVGIFGLLFRNVNPIYYKNQHIGFIEIGIDPEIFTKKIKQFYNLDSCVFIKKDLFKSMAENSASSTNSTIEFSDFKLFSKSVPQNETLSWLPKEYLLTNDYKFIHHNNTILAHTLDILDHNNQTIGKYLAFQDFTKIEDDYQEFIYYSLFLLILSVSVVLLILNRSYKKATDTIEEYLYMLNQMSDSILIVELNTHNIIFVNDNAVNTLGYTREEFLNFRIEDCSAPISGNKELFTDENINLLKSTKNSIKVKSYSQTKNGEILPVDLSLSYVKKDIEYIVVVCHNLVDEIESNLKNTANESMIQHYIPISQTDLNGDIVYVNEAFCNLVGYEEKELLGISHKLIKHPDTPSSTYKELWDAITQDKSWSSTLQNVKKDGSSVWVEIFIEPIYDYMSKRIGYISTRKDISDKKELEYLSEHDPLTKAKNRRYFEREMHRYIYEAKRYENSDSHFGLVMFDIDYFKSVNDIHGHHVGDLVLTKLTRSIHQNIRESDIFARWGGEEFIILCPHADIESLQEFINKLQNAVLNTDFTPVPKITISFGITVFKEDDTMNSIEQRVDRALYKAKENGRDRYEVIL